MLKRYLYLFLRLRNWKSRIQSERKKKVGPDLLTLRNGLKLKTEGSVKITNDIFLEIFQSNSYLKFIRTPPNTLVDVGGHFGFFSSQIALKYPKCRILAFEPAPLTFNVLKQNISLNNLENVELFNIAVGSQEGVISFFESDQHECSSLFELKKGTKKIDVPITTLENIINDKALDVIDILKLDCEGAEFDIIQNSIATLSRSVKCVICEYHIGLGKDKELERDLVVPLQTAHFLVKTHKINSDLGYLIARNEQYNS